MCNLFLIVVNGKPNSFGSKVCRPALVGVAQLIECSSVHQKVAGVIPGQDIFPGSGFNSRLRCLQRQLVNAFFSSLSLPPFHPIPLKNLMKKIFFKARCLLAALNFYH